MLPELPASISWKTGVRLSGHHEGNTFAMDSESVSLVGESVCGLKLLVTNAIIFFYRHHDDLEFVEAHTLVAEGLIH